MVTDDVACRAPAVAMHFSLTGDVHACCQNAAYSFGSVRESSLTEIWDGLRRHAMADDLARGEYPRGCEICEVEHGLGNRAATPAPEFDVFTGAATAWPRKMEFTLSNRCNLACIQCNGDNSSTIRSQREGRPPLPVPYEDSFFAQLPPFLERLEVASFLGGEPFLAPEAKRVWDLLLACENRPIVRVTTNATVWNDAVEGYVRGLEMHLAVSIDAATKETFEAIRIGARWERVIEIRDKMLAACRSHGGYFHLNYCLLRANWHEVGSFLLEADRLDVDANVIHVFGPPEHSLFTLPAAELASVVDQLGAEDRTLGRLLGRNRRAWEHLLRTLRDQVGRRESDDSREVRISSIRARREADAERRERERVEAASAFAAQLRRTAEQLEAERRRLADLLEVERRRLSEPLLAAAEADLRAWAGQELIVVRVEDDVVRDVEAPGWAAPLRPDSWAGQGIQVFGEAASAGYDAVEFREAKDLSEGEGMVYLAESILTSSEGPTRFRTLYAPLLGRMVIGTPAAYLH